MKTKYTSIISAIVLLAGILLSSCSEEITDLKVDSTLTRLMVEGTISTDTTKHLVILSKSGDALNKSGQVFLSNAIVTISDGTNVFPLTEESAGHYYTASDVYGVVGKTYTLNISHVDLYGDGALHTFTSSCELRGENPIDSIKVVRSTEQRDNKGWLVNLYARDGGGGQNYYLIKVEKNDTLVTDSTFEYGFTSNVGFEGQYYDGISVYWLSEGKKDEVVRAKDTVTLELIGITQGYYDFLYDFISEYYPKTPLFSGPSANISTNISPKDMSYGFFAAYSIQRKSIIYEP